MTFQVRLISLPDRTNDLVEALAADVGVSNLLVLPGAVGISEILGMFGLSFGGSRLLGPSGQDHRRIVRCRVRCSITSRASSSMP